MDEQRDSLRYGWLVPALVGVAQLKRFWFMWHLPEQALAQYAPDDSFYYLVSAKHFATLGRWTFDGVEPATGFHWLWAYLLAGVYWLWPGAGLHAVVMAGNLLGIVCVVAAAWLCCRIARTAFGRGAEAGVAIIFFSPLAVVQATLMMEGPLALLFAASLFYWISRQRDRQTLSTYGVAAALGFGGMLARSDFGLLPACLVAASLVGCWRRDVGFARLWLALTALLGSAAGLPVVMLQTYLIAGHWVQASAAQKLRWAHIDGYPFRPIWRLLTGLFGFSLPAWSRITAWTASAAGTRSLEVLRDGWMIAVLLGAGWMLFRGSWRARAAVVAGLLTLTGYVLLYRLTGRAWTLWYGAQFMVPGAILAAAACASGPRWLRWAAAAVAGVTCCGALLQPPDAGFFYQEPMVRGGLYLKQHPELKPSGAWNAGIVSYFAGGDVVNLDGLVNDGIAPYTNTSTTAKYVGARGLHSIYDSGVMFRHPMAVRGGYADGKLRGCLDADNLFAADPLNGKLLGEPFVLYRVKPDCPGLK